MASGCRSSPGCGSVFSALDLQLKYLPFHLIQSLDRLLNPKDNLNGNDWRMIADHFLKPSVQHVHYIESLDKNDVGGSNFQKLLQIHLKDEKLGTLLEVLKKIGRKDAVDCIDGFLPELQEYIESGRPLLGDIKKEQLQRSTISMPAFGTTRIDYPKRNIKVMISYTPGARTHVKNLMDTLEAQKNFKFETLLVHSQVTENEIAQGYRECAFIVICISEDYMQAIRGQESLSRNAEKVLSLVELELKTGNSTRIIPLFCSDKTRLKCPKLFKNCFPSGKPYTWPHSWRDVLFKLSKPEFIMTQLATNKNMAPVYQSLPATDRKKIDDSVSCYSC